MILNLPTSHKARELETPKWMRQGFSDKITDEDRDYEVRYIKMKRKELIAYIEKHK